MRLSGTLRSWIDDRGFGFIAPTHGGPEIFVHISALPRDGSRPTVGETLTYELQRGKNGKNEAVKVLRQAVGLQPPKSYPPKPSVKPSTTTVEKMIGIVVILALVAFGFTQYRKRAENYSRPTQAETQTPEASANPISLLQQNAGKFNCDGRRYCSQMTSCAEATYFLKNCPGTEMDGDNDGIPCESQWCR